MSSAGIAQAEKIWLAAGVAILIGACLADNALNGTGEADEASLQAGTDALSRIPQQIGPWNSTDGEISDEEQKVAGITGYLRRAYHDERNGYTVNLTVLCGPSGPIAVHPPTACFKGVGYELSAGPHLAKFGSDDQWQFNRCSFRQGDVSVPETVRVFWGWGTQGDWSAPESPRFAFRGESRLFKIYVTDEWVEDPDSDALPQAEAFMKDALPVISSVLSSVDGSHK